mmetsp:Transcript_6007/g.17899  ORF Transcript_6007/g.17899 Transcript_6007/m.17899 type:complete len:202 (+) Transcript_6007:41-646(+)
MPSPMSSSWSLPCVSMTSPQAALGLPTSVTRTGLGARGNGSAYHLSWTWRLTSCSMDCHSPASQRAAQCGPTTRGWSLVQLGACMQPSQAMLSLLAPPCASLTLHSSTSLTVRGCYASNARRPVATTTASSSKASLPRILQSSRSTSTASGHPSPSAERRLLISSCSMQSVSGSQVGTCMARVHSSPAGAGQEVGKMGPTG